jgi:hypothetical protein
MKKIGEIAFPGASGKEYTFKLFPYNTEFKTVGCVYIVTVRRPVGGGVSYGHTALYVGQTADLAKTWNSGHPRKNCFQEHNADFICVYDEDNEQARLAMVDDLKKKLQLKC